MADQSGGEGWWQASDLKWYPPDQRLVNDPLPPPLPPADQSPGPGYWMASDGNWYPPESQPGAATMGQWSAAGYELTLPPGTQLSSRWKRLGGALVTSVLIVVTLVIGYIVWAFAIYGRGQTPAKQLLNMYVVDDRTGQPASWGTMFLRGWIIDGVLGQMTFGLFSLVSALWIFGNDKNQRLTDKMLNTLVIDAPSGFPA
jgi:uncharacterized RDD family membrane protein YckC